MYIVTSIKTYSIGNSLKMSKNTDWEKVSFRVRNKITEKVKTDTRARFAAFLGAAGGATSIAHSTGVSIGLIKGVQGNKDRLISPVMAVRLTEMLSSIVPDKFTREYLRPDLTSIQWERLDYLIEQCEKKPEPAMRKGLDF